MALVFDYEEKVDFSLMCLSPSCSFGGWYRFYPAGPSGSVLQWKLGNSV